LETSVVLATQAMECLFCGSTHPLLIDFGTRFRVSGTVCSADRLVVFAFPVKALADSIS